MQDPIPGEPDVRLIADGSSFALPGRRTSIIPYFYHERRMRHVGGVRTDPVWGAPPKDEHDARLRKSYAADLNIERYLSCVPVPTLQQHIVLGTLAPGAQFTLRAKFVFNNPRGLDAFTVKPDTRVPFRTNVSLGSTNLTVAGELDPNHYTSNSSFGELQGSRALTLLAYVIEATPHAVVVRPVVMGDVITHLKNGDGTEWRLHDHLEIQPEEILEFRKLADVPPPTPEELQRMKAISEGDVKKALQEIIGHPFEEKDWGGETQDVFAKLTLHGARRVAAFLLKGPGSGFTPMNAADHLGAKGDQLVRLFSRRTEIVVVQHCHRILPEVREQAIAFAERPGQERIVCLLDGADTYRLLKAHGKCGIV